MKKGKRSKLSKLVAEYLSATQQQVDLVARREAISEEIGELSKCLLNDSEQDLVVSLGKGRVALLSFYCGGSFYSARERKLHD